MHLQQLTGNVLTNVEDCSFIRTDVPPQRFLKLLEALDMTPDSASCPGLVRVDDATLIEKRRVKAPLEEIVALERALRFKFKPTYLYFRHFLQRPPMAMAYVYDWTERLDDARNAQKKARPNSSTVLEDELSELHRHVWSACEIPLVYVFLPTEVQIYHLLQGPEEGDNGIKCAPIESIAIGESIAEELRQFSARRLDDGRFWEENAKSKALGLSGAAFMALSQEIAICRDELVNEHQIPDALVRRLLILFVLVKYLEERRDHLGNSVFPAGTFAYFASKTTQKRDPSPRRLVTSARKDKEAREKVKSFVDLLRSDGDGALAFFDALAQADRFNGDVFRLDDSEEAALRDKNLLRIFADLLEGKNEGKQRTFWRRYAFEELPVELISHLYEQFIPKQPGVVYTPPFLVNFILDEVLPLSEETPESFHILDPACGSGVFLVGAFRRLVHRWRQKNNYAYPDAETLKVILRDHIFGVDIEGEAVRLTMFSLSLALCDFLEPRTIWDRLHFDRLLDKNLFVGDFFEHFPRWQDTREFDLVVGNPPFREELTAEEKSVVRAFEKNDPTFDLPITQAALLFLKCAALITKSDARIALVQPSGPLLYNENSSRFRKPFFESIQVTQIVDLTHLSRVLFKRPRLGAPNLKGEVNSSKNPGDVAVAVIFAENHLPDDSPLLHVTVRRTAQAEQKLLFEIDHYDLHFISPRDARENASIWKANFIGGGRIPRLLRRFEGSDSLGKFIEEKKLTNGWVASEGYTEGKEEKIARREMLGAKQDTGSLTSKEHIELNQLESDYKEASWLTGHQFLPSEAFTANGIDRRMEVPIEKKFFARGRQKELFQGPVLLIKLVIEAETAQIPVALVQDDIRFLKGIYGIHAPLSDIADLERICDLVRNSKLVQFHILATSSRYLVDKSSAIKTADLMKVPFPRSSKDVKFTRVEQAFIDDAVDYAADYKRKGEGAAILEAPNAEHLDQFGEFFCLVLGSVYPTLKRSAPIALANAICCPFYFGDTPSEAIDESEASALRIDNILSTTIGSSLRCQRILRVFHGNMLLIVKPPQLRYWLRSIAVRDADEVFAELRERGY